MTDPTGDAGESGFDESAPLGSTTTGGLDASHADAKWLSRLESASADPAVCPFLRSIDQRGELAAATDHPDPFNRCAALHEPVPQSMRQQELVCLTSGHVNCPRYLRGAIVATEPPRDRRWRRPGGTSMTPAILAASLLLVASFAGSIAFVVARGGLTMPVAVPDRATPVPTVVAVAPTEGPSIAPIVPSPSPTAAPTPEPTPSRTTSPAPTPSPTPEPTRRPTPRPTAAGDPILARFPELRRCPNRSNCYIYVVEPGNNLYSIANYYRVSYDRVLAMNPWITNPANIHAGDQVRLPTPQRP